MMQCHVAAGTKAELEGFSPQVINHIYLALFSAGGGLPKQGQAWHRPHIHQLCGPVFRMLVTFIVV